MAHFETRGEAIDWAIRTSDPGDEVFLHADTCTAFDNDEDCDCDPIIVKVMGYRSELKTIGFKAR